ncbi:MAG TPA: sigma-70 family RNA polymerase sigma factor [Spirochaetia bacterium]|nr:sigma-70 family RNA polymerase sigma factor [Spirochaetia bacterium]
MTVIERNQTILEFRPLIEIAINQLNGRLPKHWRKRREDLRSIGTLAMLQALDKYQPERSDRLACYLIFKIRYGIFDTIRESDHTRRIGTKPKRTDFETATRTLPDRTISPERLAIQADVWRHVGKLPARLRRILKLYYRDQLTMREIAERLDVSEGRVSQLHARALRLLRKEMI